MDEITKYEKLRDIILARNEQINVTAIRDSEEFMKRNIADSLSICGLQEFESARTVVDLGTGGGFPGLPLAIARPDKNFLLADSVAKKLKIVEEAARELGLSNISTLHIRAEDMGRDEAYREKFDLAVSRAVAEMAVLCEYCLPLVRPTGYFIAYKTIGAKEEIKTASEAIRRLGGELAYIVQPGEYFKMLKYSTIDASSDGQFRAEAASPQSEETGHILVVINKIKNTPAGYPRKAGTPAKNPIQ